MGNKPIEEKSEILPVSQQLQEHYDKMYNIIETKGYLNVNRYEDMEGLQLIKIIQQVKELEDENKLLVEECEASARTHLENKIEYDKQLEEFKKEIRLCNWDLPKEMVLELVDKYFGDK